MENKDIINILCVEDGSIDIQNLEENGLQDGKVLVYRQGSRPPFVLHLPRNSQQLKVQQTQLAIEKLEELQIRLLGLEKNIYTNSIIIKMISELKGE